MDDILRTIKQRFILTKLKEINSLHTNLKFSLEVETEGKIPFLDLCINQTNNKLSSTWYCKPTDTGLIMNYHASAPNCYKNSVLKSFVH